MNNIYFFLTGLKALQLHFLQVILFSDIFIGDALILDLHLLQIKIFLKSLSSASGIFAILDFPHFVRKLSTHYMGS